ncbi:MAG: hypothetical protein A2W91_07310 [Bacteroidetes bacterium GWF2_38_335]|nr:MAG: hypothetical protein A2W91_07310 [Bacteroidetes bacterium GWF2_38_335]OFY77136.1 MAG: hypothetical protein A2281_14545 [Bacteroidetes bacterium RIFOXYA12_FULL_38_20]HBS85027.1 hypothetical protein [Bacteroidales bacterium]
MPAAVVWFFLFEGFFLFFACGVSFVPKMKFSRMLDFSRHSFCSPGVTLRCTPGYYMASPLGLVYGRLICSPDNYRDCSLPAAFIFVWGLGLLLKNRETFGLKGQVNSAPAIGWGLICC